MMSKLLLVATSLLLACNIASSDATLAAAPDLERQLMVQVFDGVELQVSISSSGGVRITKWPDQITSTVRMIGQPASVIAGTFDATRCAYVKSNLGSLYKSQLTSESQKQSLLAQIRSNSSFNLHISLNPLAQTDLILKKTEKAAQDAGLSLPALYLLESANFTDYELTASFTDDATTTIFGNAHEVAKSFETAIQENILASAETTIQFPAYDFMCDLLNKKVHLNWTFTTKFHTTQARELFPIQKSSEVIAMTKVAIKGLNDSSLTLVALTEVLRKIAPVHQLSPAHIVSLHTKILTDDSINRVSSRKIAKILEDFNTPSETENYKQQSTTVFLSK